MSPSRQMHCAQRYLEQKYPLTLKIERNPVGKLSNIMKDDYKNFCLSGNYVESIDPWKCTC